MSTSCVPLLADLVFYSKTTEIKQDIQNEMHSNSISSADTLMTLMSLKKFKFSEFFATSHLFM